MNSNQIAIWPSDEDRKVTIFADNSATIKTYLKTRSGTDAFVENTETITYLENDIWEQILNLPVGDYLLKIEVDSSFNIYGLEVKPKEEVEFIIKQRIIESKVDAKNSFKAVG